jgi:hypothetical protein
MKTKKIIKVLKFIKKYCLTIAYCKECPFSLENRCLLCLRGEQSYPDIWRVNDIKIKLKGIERIEIYDESRN